MAARNDAHIAELLTQMTVVLGNMQQQQQQHQQQQQEFQQQQEQFQQQLQQQQQQHRMHEDDKRAEELHNRNKRNQQQYGPQRHKRFNPRSKGPYFNKAKGKGKAIARDKSTPPARAPLCKRCNRNHPGRFCHAPRAGVCFNCGKPGHFARDCKEPVKRPMKQGRVSTLSGAEAIETPNLVQGIYFLNNQPCLVWFGSGASHSLFPMLA